MFCYGQKPCKGVSSPTRMHGVIAREWDTARWSISCDTFLDELKHRRMAFNTLCHRPPHKKMMQGSGIHDVRRAPRAGKK